MKNDKVDEVIEDVTGQNATDVKKKVGETLETAKHKVAEGYDKVSHKAQEVWEKTADKSLNDVVHAVNDYVKHKPGKSLAIAAGAGLLIGLLLRGRPHY